MRNIISICLPFWSLERRRLNAAPNIPPACGVGRPRETRWRGDEPIALTAEIKGAQRITMLNRAALKLGLRIGNSLTDARAVFPDLIAYEADFAGDKVALEKLCHWFIRYTPFANFVINGAKVAILLDVTGCTHLWGGERALMDDIFTRLGKMGISARIALAPSIGAAWALSFYGNAKNGIIYSDKGEILALDIAALRLEDSVNDNLRALGLKRIGDIAIIPTKSLARRFGMGVLRQLNRALGEDEPLSPIKEIILDKVDVKILHAVLTSEGLEKYLSKAVEDICAHLATQNKGAKQLQIALYRVDGVRFNITANAANAHNRANIWQKLITERLEIQKEAMDFGFGIDLISAEAHFCETIKAQDGDLDPVSAAALQSAEAVHRLAERLSARIGANNVVRLKPRQCWTPEQAQTAIAALNNPEIGDYPAHIAMRRPSLMLPRPELIEAIAEIPDGPPRQIRFRRLSLKISHSTSAERIMAGEIRDYYQVTAQSGEKLFLYRQGLYGDAPKWFAAGVG